jgi:hypothetical protein
VVERVRVEWPEPQRVRSHRMLFTFAALHDDPGRMIGRWFDIRARVGDAAGFFFAALERGPMTLHSQLFNLMNFSEAYQRSEHPEQPVGDEVHDELVGRMLAGLPTDAHRDVYKNPLQHANSLTQRQRLDRLIARAAEVVPGVSSLQEAKLGRNLTHTRNWLTHWERRTRHVLEPPELFHALRQFVLVLQINLMLDLGLDEETVATCVRRSYANEVILPIGEEGKLGPL